MGMRTTQSQEGQFMGGTAPGGVTSFVGSPAQWSGKPRDATPGDVTTAACMQHVGLGDEAPDGSGNVPIHPGFLTGQVRDGDDANPVAPDGMFRDQGRF